MTKTENTQLILHQSEYIESILNEYKNKDIKIRIRNTPLPHDLKPLVEEVNGDQPSILDLLGKLRYLADRTRPDISFAASFLARFAGNPTIGHVNAIYQTLGYIDKTKDQGLTIGSPTKQIKLFAMSDASFVRDNDSKGQLCYNLFLANDAGAFFTKSQKDKNVSISSFHSEINALVEAIKMVAYYRDILAELSQAQIEPSTIFLDNQSVIMVSTNITKDSRSMYLTNKINFIREYVNNKIVNLQYIPTGDNVADLGTKSLSVIQHNVLSDKLLKGIQSITTT
jgi:histone deacetylase 1/2